MIGEEGELVLVPAELVQTEAAPRHAAHYDFIYFLWWCKYDCSGLLLSLLRLLTPPGHTYPEWEDFELD